MKIGVISDTHGSVAALDRALALFDGADLIVHAGDVLYHPPKLGCAGDYDIPAFAQRLNELQIPLMIAQGNCDSQVYEELLEMPVQSPYAIAQVEGIWIVVNHGHLLDRAEMIATGRRYRANYFISGHTHVPVLEDVGGLVLLNPGSPAIPKLEVDGMLAPSVALIDDAGARVLNINDGSVIASLASSP